MQGNNMGSRAGRGIQADQDVPLVLAGVVEAKPGRDALHAHFITLNTNHPLRKIMQRTEVNGRLVKWAIELGEFDIPYRPKIAIKGHAAANFISKLTPMKATEGMVGDHMEESAGAGIEEVRE
ncbi:hypothetical protein ACLB2K_031758 [Fragaria x ananassa]